MSIRLSWLLLLCLPAVGLSAGSSQAQMQDPIVSAVETPANAVVGTTKANVSTKADSKANTNTNNTNSIDPEKTNTPNTATPSAAAPIAPTEVTSAAKTDNAALIDNSDNSKNTINSTDKSTANGNTVTAAAETAAPQLTPLPTEQVSTVGSPTGSVEKVIDLTAPQSSLWARIRNGFAMQNINDDLTLYYQQRYQNSPEALRRMVRRAQPFLHHIVEEIEVRGMPTELALLPMVESAFNPMADSPAQASGLWQFIPATGRRFNLEQDWWHDQRRDIVASTSAALDYLQNIYDLHGDWHLALASYNWGEGAVGRAVERNENNELPTDYLNLRMPQETRHYVPKLQALKNIFANPALLSRMGIEDIPNHPYLATLEMRQAIDVNTAAKLANMSKEEFIRLNPAHKRQIIKPATEMVLPADRLDTFYTNLQNYGEPLNRWEAYRLEVGEDLHDVAARFDIPHHELLKMNSLDAQTRLAAGSTILVPAGQGSVQLDPYLDQTKLPQIIVPNRAKVRYVRNRKGKIVRTESVRGQKAETRRTTTAKRNRAQKSSKITQSPKQRARQTAAVAAKKRTYARATTSSKSGAKTNRSAAKSSKANKSNKPARPRRHG